MTNKVRNSVAAFAMVAALVGVTNVVSPAPAQAAATGCAVTITGGSASAGGVSFPIPQGQYCVNVSGTGTYVDYVWTQFSMVGSLCHYSVTAEFFDRQWRWLRTQQGPTTSGCALADNGWYNSNLRLPVRANVQPGFICSTLKSGGTRVSSKCFGIS